MSSKYTYMPLSSAESIRVVDLLPSSKLEEPIIVRLREVPLSQQAIHYEALSYVWGAVKGYQTIYCGSLQFSLRVTHNCFLALRHLRHQTQQRTLWIDAICINQSDDDISTKERMQQIQRMGDIYQLASRVIIWLDFKEYGNLGLLRLLRESSRQKKLLDKKLGFLGVPLKFLYDLRRPFFASSLIPESTWLAFLRNPWFSRVWTVQEVAFARSAIVKFGNLEIDWDIVANGISKLEQTPRKEFNEEFRVLAGLVKLRGHAAQARNTAGRRTTDDEQRLNQQRDLLANLPNLQSSLGHDKVFGLYAFLNTWGLSLPEPDYLRPVVDVYTELIFAFIKLRGDLWPLTTTLPAQASTGLPSWVPNLLERPPEKRETDLSGVFYDAPIPQVGASKDSKAEPLLGSDFKALHLKGRLFGTISSRIWDRSRFNRACKSWFVSQEETDPHWLLLQLMLYFGYIPYNKHLGLRKHEDYQKAAVWSWSLHMLSDSRSEAVSALKSPDQHPESVKWLASNVYKGLHPEQMYWRLTNLSDDVQEVANYYNQYAFIGFENNWMGRAHYSCRKGDEVWILAGSKYPLVLRRQGIYYRIIGPAYILGAMEGQHWPEDESELVPITLV